MSAFTRAYVTCDYRDLDSVAGSQFCFARLDDSDPEARPMSTKAEVRAEAKRQGWLTVRRGLGIVDDYCPDHRAAHERQKEAPGE